MKMKNVGLQDIHNPNITGQISWDDSVRPITFTVDFPDPKLRSEIESYLSSIREFWIPESNRIDDYRVDHARPIDDPIYFDLALNSILGKVHVYVIWNS